MCVWICFVFLCVLFLEVWSFQNWRYWSCVCVFIRAVSCVYCFSTGLCLIHVCVLSKRQKPLWTYFHFRSQVVHKRSRANPKLLQSGKVWSLRQRHQDLQDQDLQGTHRAFPTSATWRQVPKEKSLNKEINLKEEEKEEERGGRNVLHHYEEAEGPGDLWEPDKGHWQRRGEVIMLKSKWQNFLGLRGPLVLPSSVHLFVRLQEFLLLFHLSNPSSPSLPWSPSSLSPLSPS